MYINRRNIQAYKRSYDRYDDDDDDDDDDVNFLIKLQAT